MSDSVNDLVLVDMEWVELLKEARDLGISIEEVNQFLSTFGAPI